MAIQEYFGLGVIFCLTASFLLKLSDVFSVLESKAKEEKQHGIVQELEDCEMRDQYHHHPPLDHEPTYYLYVYFLLVFLGWTSDVFAVSILPYGIWAALTGGELIFHAIMTHYILKENYTSKQVCSLILITLCVVCQALTGASSSSESSKSAFEKVQTTITLIELEFVLPLLAMVFIINYLNFFEMVKESNEYIERKLWREDYRPRPLSNYHLTGCLCAAIATSLLQSSVKLTANSVYPNYHHGAFAFLAMFLVCLVLHIHMIRLITSNLDETATIPIYTVLTNLCNNIYSHVFFNDVPTYPFLFVASILMTIVVLFIALVVEDMEYTHTAIPHAEACHLCHNCGKLPFEVHDPPGIFAICAPHTIVPERIDHDNDIYTRSSEETYQEEEEDFSEIDSTLFELGRRENLNGSC